MQTVKAPPKKADEDCRDPLFALLQYWNMQVSIIHCSPYGSDQSCQTKKTLLQPNEVTCPDSFICDAQSTSANVSKPKAHNIYKANKVSLLLPLFSGIAPMGHIQWLFLTVPPKQVNIQYCKIPSKSRNGLTSQGSIIWWKKTCIITETLSV